MGIISRNVKTPKTRWLRELSVTNLAVTFVILSLGVALIVAITTAHGSRIPVSQSNLPQGPNKSESVNDNVYTIGQKVFCWDSSTHDGEWFPCTIVGVEDNHRQYFINAPADTNHTYFHVSGRDITASGTYKGAY